MNLKNLILVSSICAFGNVFCSQNNTTIIKKSESQEALATESSSSKQNAAPISNTPSAANNSSTKSEISSTKVAPSNWLTKTYYGVAKHVAGKSAYATYMELHESGKLAADYETNPHEAMNRLNAAAHEGFTSRDLLSAEQQAKRSKLLKTAFKISNQLVLAKALAAKYLELQQNAVIATLERQALETEPALRQKRDETIKQAKLEYTASLNNEFIHATDAASNCRYLHKQAESTQKFDYQDKKHYTGLPAYSALLESIQEKSVTPKAVPTISITNAAHEAKYVKYSTSFNPADLD